MPKLSIGNCSFHRSLAFESLSLTAEHFVLEWKLNNYKCLLKFWLTLLWPHIVTTAETWNYHGLSGSLGVLFLTGRINSSHPSFWTLLVETGVPDWLKVKTQHIWSDCWPSLLCIFEEASHWHCPPVSAPTWTFRAPLLSLQRTYRVTVTQIWTLGLHSASINTIIYSMQKKANTHLLLFTALLWRLPEAVFWLMLFNALGDPEDAACNDARHAGSKAFCFTRKYSFLVRVSLWTFPQMLVVIKVF